MLLEFLIIHLKTIDGKKGTAIKPILDRARACNFCNKSHYQVKGLKRTLSKKAKKELITDDGST